MLRPDGRWHALPAGAFDSEPPILVKANALGAVDVLTERSVWRIHPDSAPRRLISTNFPFDVISLSDGRSLVLAPERVVEISRTGRRDLLSPGAITGTREIALAERNGTIWVSRDNSLVALRPGEPPEVVRFVGRATFGGPLLVDREGSLWVGSNALHQFPEPETWVWNDVAGLNLRAARFLEKTGSTIWVGTWGDMHSIRRSASGWTLTKNLPTLAHLCTDSMGVTWT